MAQHVFHLLLHLWRCSMRCITVWNHINKVSLQFIDAIYSAAVSWRRNNTDSDIIYSPTLVVIDKEKTNVHKLHLVMMILLNKVTSSFESVQNMEHKCIGLIETYNIFGWHGDFVVFWITFDREYHFINCTV